jgi:hypothetical protein
MNENRNPIGAVLISAASLGLLFGLWMNNIWAAAFLFNSILFLNAYIKDLLK